MSSAGARPKTGQKRRAIEKGDEASILQRYMDTPVTVNHYVIANNSYINLGSSVGNKITYELPSKLYGLKDGERDLAETEKLKTKISEVVQKRRPGQTTLEDICRECDAKAVGVESGCVKLTLRFSSREGLERYWNMYSSGELHRRLKTDFPIRRVEISESDYKRGCQFFDELEKQRAVSKAKLKGAVDKFESAAIEYACCRRNTVILLLELVEYINRRQRVAQATTVAGAVGLALAFFTLGTSSAIPAAAAGAVTVLAALVVQGITAKMSADSAKATMTADEEACKKVVTTLEEVESRLTDWKEVEEGVLINSIYELVKVRKMDLAAGQKVFDTFGRFPEDMVSFVIITVSLETIIVHILDIFSAEMSKMAKKISELARTLDCGNERPMKELVSEIREKVHL